ncbi:MAG: redoxin domain-containing protein [Desulfobacterales bacterium]|nr:redoxin domain-containing protein [Desulfobacterales bacterium]
MKVNLRGLLFLFFIFIFLTNVYGENKSDLSTAYDFTLPYLNQNGSITLSEEIAKEKFTILIFFNSKCDICMITFAKLKEFPIELTKMGIPAQIIGINNDEENLGRLRSFVKQEKITFPVLSDKLNTVSSAYKCADYSFSSFILNKDGKILDVHYDKRDDMQDYLIQKLMKFEE